MKSKLILKERLSIQNLIYNASVYYLMSYKTLHTSSTHHLLGLDVFSRESVEEKPVLASSTLVYDIRYRLLIL